MANEGYIKLYRKMMKWGWYTDTNAKCVFLHLLFLAQYEPCFYRSVRLEIGQAVTSIRDISAQTGISVKSVRTALEHLKSTQEVEQSSHGKFSVFTVKNYSDYQCEKPLKSAQETAQSANGEFGLFTGENRSDNQCDGTVSGKHVANKWQTSGTQVAQTLILRNQEVKKSRSKKDISIEISQKKIGEFENVLLDGQEHGKLVDSLGDIGASEYIERLSAYLAQTGHRYKSHYATILNWWRKDGKPVNRTPAPRVVKPDTGREITPDMTAEELF